VMDRCVKTSGVGREVKHVVQVGAATLIPKIKKMLADYFNRGINRFVDPEVSVAYGAMGAAK
jgi:molecular chaperone DnaK (HSP70)